MSEDTLPMRRETELGITPRTLDEARMMCETLFNSGLMPTEIKSPQQVFVIMQYGAEIGLKPMSALRQIFVVKGKPSPSAQLMHGMALRHPDCDFFRVSDGDGRAVVKVRRKSWPAGDVDVFTYSLDDARTAGLMGSGTWKAHPKAMLRNRVIAAAARSVFPDVLANMYQPDEVEHFSEPGGQRRSAPDASVAHEQARADDPGVVDAEVVEREPSAPPAPSGDPFAAALADGGLTVKQWDRWAAAKGHATVDALDGGQRVAAATWLKGEGSAVVAGWLSQHGGES